MTISISNPIQSTLIFECILLAALLFSIRIRKDKNIFPIAQSQELKGLAILFIVFSHIGYFLVTDHRFLFPLTIMAGVGVDLFLFLSGMGLTASALKKPLSIWNFYRKNLLKLFVPFWLTLILFLSLDFFVLKIAYSWNYIANAFVGLFTSVDLYKDLNSPLWYFTLILFYYLLFPLFFYRKRPWISAVVIYIFSLFILHQNIALISWVQSFYVLHIVAFPLGMLIGSMIFKLHPQDKTNDDKNKIWFNKYLLKVGYYALIVLLAVFIGYFSYHFGGQPNPIKEELVSIVTMSAILFLFLLKKIEFKLLQIFGIFSYEIYLLHWPILYHYDFLYRFFPAWFATAFYLLFFIGLAWTLKQVSGFILNITKKGGH